MPLCTSLNGARFPRLKGRILLVNDDIELCEVLRAVLESQRYEVTMVHRGVEGIREIMEYDFDAIICDMMMPTMAGDMFYVAVQQLKPHLSERFIFITAHGGNPRIDAFLRIAAGKILYKPLATNQLFEAIARTISEARPVDEAAIVAFESGPTRLQEGPHHVSVASRPLRRRE